MRGWYLDRVITAEITIVTRHWRLLRLTHVSDVWQCCLKHLSHTQIMLPFFCSSFYCGYWNCCCMLFWCTPCMTSAWQIHCIPTRCPKKNVVSWKNDHNYLQNHPKFQSLGCFEKFRIFATRWALRFSKLKKKWLRKWSLKLPTPPQKIGRIHCSQYTLIDPLSHSCGHYVPWTWLIRPRVQN